MKAIRDFLHNKKGKAIVGAVVLLILVLFAGTTIAAAEKSIENEEQRDQSIVKTGSGEQYETTVERHTEGNLSAQDLHQVSLLSSRVVNHLNEAINGLLDQNPDSARKEIENAQTLTKVVRDLLPVTTVTTIVKDAKGKEIYRDVDKVQDERAFLVFVFGVSPPTPVSSVGVSPVLVGDLFFASRMHRNQEVGVVGGHFQALSFQLCIYGIFNPAYVEGIYLCLRR